MRWPEESAERIRAEAEGLEAARDRLIELGRRAIKHSKNAIYAAIREDLAGAEAALADCWRVLSDLAQLEASEPGLWGEEIARVARGEAVEAELVVRVAKGAGLPGRGELPVAIDLPAFLHGLFDATGELLRAANERLLKNDVAFAARAKEVMEAVYFLGLELNPKRYDLRRKLDYVAGNLARLSEALFYARRPC